MEIIVTGVAGFIGSNLTAKLLAEGHTVNGIDNFSFGNERNISPFRNNSKFHFFERDLRHPDAFKDINGEVLVHLASQKIPRYTNALCTLDDNAIMLKSVISKCIQDKSKLVYASTSDVYGKNEKIPFSEGSDLVMGPTTVKRWAYALSKIYGEQYIIANRDEHNLNYTIVRFFGSYGPNQNLTWWGGPQSVFIANALKSQPLEIHGDGSQTRTFTFIDDTVQGLYKSIVHLKSINEIFNIASEPTEEVNILQLGTIIWKLIHGEDSKPQINLVPYSTFGNYEDVKRRVPDITKIKDALDFKPQFSLKEGLDITINWQKNI